MAKDGRVLIIGLDGMRPDLVDPELMPNLHRFVAGGSYFPDHHAAYPTHTRVNVATLATGTYPSGHGIVANVFLTQHEQQGLSQIVDTSSPVHLRNLDASPSGPALQRPTLGDILQRQDQRIAVAATSTPGAAIIWTRNQPYRIVHPDTYFDRPDLISLREKLGPIPPATGESMHDRQLYVARAVTEIFFHDPDSRVIVLWLNEPDTSLHRHGLGSPESLAALASCDAVIGHILERMTSLGLRDQFDVFILSDHGHSTVLHQRSLGEFLDRALARQEIPDIEFRTASDYIYLSRTAAASDIRRVVEWIQEQPWTGAVFGCDQTIDLPGVLSLDALWGGRKSERSPDISVSPAWTEEPNVNGVPGMVSALTEQVALRSTHGSASPYELHGFLTASGPGFREGFRSELPSGAVDLTPTILQLLGIASEANFDGRALSEALIDWVEPPGDRQQMQIEPEVNHPGGFKPQILLERVGSTTYVDRVTNGMHIESADAKRGRR